MSRRQVTPTRSNLMDTRKTLELARVGHDILDKKSEVLTAQLVRAAHDAARVQSECRRWLLWPMARSMRLDW
jgi:V/A-type H+/Na+-transporting ATPase subunit D